MRKKSRWKKCKDYTKSRWKKCKTFEQISIFQEDKAFSVLATTKNPPRYCARGGFFIIVIRC